MDARDIWLLLAGAVLAYAVNLLTTYTVPPLNSAFGKLRAGFIERNKSRALAAYAFVHDLKTGKRDKYLYAINGWGMLGAMMLVLFTAVLMGLVIRRAFDLPNEAAPGFRLLLALAIAVGLAVMVLSRIMRLALTLYRLDNFEAYRASLLRRWPDIKLPDAD
jgi:hypothetical protein